MKCVICGQDKLGINHELSISGKKLIVFVCDDCENDKGIEYANFFDNLRKKDGD